MGTSNFPRIGAFIRDNRERIIAHWEHQARQLPTASKVEHPRLINHLPELLDLIVNLLNDPTRITDALARAPEEHALQRLDLGFDLKAVAAEYGMLRRSILQLFHEHDPDHPSLLEMASVNEVIDGAIGRAVVRYSKSQERTLQALDRITEAGLGGQPPDLLLPRLLSVLLETTEAVDSAAIYLSESGKLHMRASATRRGVPQVSVSLVYGEGLVGRIAKSKSPLEQIDGAQLGERRLRTLYGVPLMEGDELIGVAEIGSTTAPELSREDKVLLGSMAGRAAALIYQARLRESEKVERQRARESLRLVRRDLEDRERLMGILAHDLRGPLAMISLTAASLDRPDRHDAATVEAAARIADGARRMTRMINDLLDFTRSRLGRDLLLALAPTNLAKLCQRCLDEIALSHPDRQIALAVKGDCRGVWDADRISRAIDNLLGNAVKYSSPDSPIQVRLKRQDEDVHLEVSNEGPPIPPEIQAKIFEPHLSGDAAGDSGGLGLGLFIVRQVVLAHEGTVDARSDENGVTFHVRLPVHPPEPDKRQRLRAHQSRDP